MDFSEIGILLFYGVPLSIFVAYKIYEFLYYRSDNFSNIKSEFKKNAIDCNELNSYIEELKNTYSNIKQVDYGTATINFNNNYNYKNTKAKNTTKNAFVFDCTASVLKNAHAQPFKYLCKYFDIQPTEETLEEYEKVLNNFLAAEDGKVGLKNQLNTLKKDLKGRLPFLISLFSMKKTIKNLGVNSVNFSTVYFPTYTFRYISPGGNKNEQCKITLDIKNLTSFVNYLSTLVKFRKSAEGQRALMTPKLRQYIKERDNFTCKMCDNSTRFEPNLLLEIDHIIPIAKGGITTEENLQTLCWKCNRSKGAK